MDRSVDSIGSCSVDMDASVDSASGWSEKSSTGTLLSASILSNTPEPQHLPSYLNLACTVNGYSTITNYDPIRLSRSRDVSPHRIDSENLTQQYNNNSAVTNNLLSPPNLVPLPIINNKTIMTDQQFYTTSNTIESYCSKETRFSSKFISKDVVDACYENSHREKFISSYEKTTSVNNRQQQQQTVQSNGSSIEMCKTETKSFIQQRVERLYGPGALAQGFFVKKRQKNRLSESEVTNKKESSSHVEKHSKSLTDKLLLDDEAPDEDESSTNSMRQSTSSPVLPVLRHLRPEFRAQLPIMSTCRKNSEIVNGNSVNVARKSDTSPALKEGAESKTNGHVEEGAAIGGGNVVEIKIEEIGEESDVKDGHYFLKILERETGRLLKLADECESNLETFPEMSEDAIGRIRSAAGKARLLVSQKMQQFKGLCSNNITQVEGEAFPTTNEDLQGFWDMVMLQVNQVDVLFEDIEKLKRNDWKELEPVIEKSKPVSNGSNKMKKTTSRVAKTSSSNVADETRKQREIERKRLIEERRKAMKMRNNQENIEIFVPESS